MSSCVVSFGRPICRMLPSTPNLARQHKSVASLKQSVHPWFSRYSRKGSNVVASQLRTTWARRFLISAKIKCCPQQHGVDIHLAYPPCRKASDFPNLRVLSNF